MESVRWRRRVLPVAMLGLWLAGCGGDDSPADDDPGETPPPMIQVTVNANAPTLVSTGGAPPPFNAVASVGIHDPQTLAPITGGFTASVNGVALSPSTAGIAALVGGLNLDPGARIDVTVTYAGRTYQATANNVTSFPALTTPANDVVWQAGVANTVAWTSTAPNGEAVHLLALLSTAGSWPGNMPLQLPGYYQSHEVPAGSVLPGTYSLRISLLDQQPLNAVGVHALSRIALLSSDARNVTVVAGP